MKRLLVTGCSGLIGSQVVEFFCSKFYKEEEWEVIGIDNNMRKYFFGDQGSTFSITKYLIDKFENFKFFEIDIRDQNKINNLFRKNTFDLIIHTAAQPSHDWAAKEPMTDFTVNANGTLILLEAFKEYSPEATFIFTSTNKVYGDTPNNLYLLEQETRYDLPLNHNKYDGIDETMSIDDSKHSLFGVSKAAADLLVQEYGRYFDLDTASFRGGCLTGPRHSGVELHGFLSYLVKSYIHRNRYIVYGYKAKQVRDNIHSFDLVNAFYHYYRYRNTKLKYYVYNIGGSRFSNISMLEAINKLEILGSDRMIWQYNSQNRAGDHQWYISNVNRFKSVCPKWDYQWSIDSIIEDIYKYEVQNVNS